MAAASRSVASSGDKNIAREEKGREGKRISVLRKIWQFVWVPRLGNNVTGNRIGRRYEYITMFVTGRTEKMTIDRGRYLIQRKYVWRICDIVTSAPRVIVGNPKE